MMKLRVCLFIFVAALFASCSTIVKTAESIPIKADITSLMVADMDVSRQKATMTYSWNFNPFKHANIDRIKGNVTAEILIRHDGDVLIEPQYIVIQRGFLRGGSVTVSGYPAKFVDFHRMTPDEHSLIYFDDDAKSE